jgi:two-component system OmpR family response regulator
MRVLIVEDEVKMASLIRRGLRDDGMAADVAIKGQDALWMAGSTEYDAIVLDVMLLGMDGFQVCRRLRADGVWWPVLMLTARDAIDDRVRGLDTGADDYLTKPFSFAELAARLRALARRGPVERATVLRLGDLRLDPSSKRVWRGETDIGLSAKEFSLLETFMRRPGAGRRAAATDRVARHGGQHQRDRPADDQEAAEVAQRLLAILQRSADDDDEPAILRAHRRGQDPDRIVLTGDRLAIDDDGLANLVRKLLALEQRTPAHGWRGVDDVSGRLDDLREALPLLGQGAACRLLQPAIGLLDGRGHVAGA